jgi:hypothetical protein
MSGIAKRNGVRNPANWRGFAFSRFGVAHIGRGAKSLISLSKYRTKNRTFTALLTHICMQ